MIKLAVLGVGYWGPNLVRNVKELPGAHLAGICDLSPIALKHIREKYPDVPLFTNCKQMIKKTHPDAVLIATPAHTHFSLVKNALHQNLHVLVEKPLAMNSRQARELTRLAENRNLTLMAGHTFLYSNPVREVRKYIEAQELGDLFYCYSQRTSLGQIRSDIDALWNLGPHDVSILNYWTGTMPTRVSAWGFCYLNKKQQISDVVFGKIEYPGGISAHLHLSWLDPQKVRRMVVVGSKKMLVYNDMDTEKPIQIYDKRAEKEKIDPTDPLHHRFGIKSGNISVPKIPCPEPLREEIAHFISSIKSGDQPLTDGRHATDVIIVLEAMSRSLKKDGKPIEIKEIFT